MICPRSASTKENNGFYKKKILGHHRTVKNSTLHPWRFITNIHTCTRTYRFVHTLLPSHCERLTYCRAREDYIRTQVKEFIG